MGQKDKYRTCKSCLILPFELDFVGLLNTLPFPHAKVDRTLCSCVGCEAQHILSFQAGSFAIISVS